MKTVLGLLVFLMTCGILTSAYSQVPDVRQSLPREAKITSGNIVWPTADTLGVVLNRCQPSKGDLVEVTEHIYNVGGRKGDHVASIRIKSGKCALDEGWVRLMKPLGKLRNDQRTQQLYIDYDLELRAPAFLAVVAQFHGMSVARMFAGGDSYVAGAIRDYVDATHALRAPH
jgi:hypothetical protein